MKFAVKPMEQVNEIRFGMDRKEVRRYLKNHYNEYRKNIFSSNTADDFRSFHVYYDENDRCEAVEIFDWDEIEIQGKGIANSIAAYQEFFPDLENDDGYISKQYSVGLSEENGVISSVLFGCEGYYE